MLPEREINQHPILRGSFTWPVRSHPCRDNILPHAHRSKRAPSNSVKPFRGTSIAAAFIARCRLESLEVVPAREYLAANLSKKLLFLLFTALFSFGAMRLQNLVSCCLDSAEPPWQLQVINAYIGWEVVLVAVMLLLVLPKQCYPTTVTNISSVSGMGHDVHQRGL